jgi:glycosyltransferase involved in cell wall biosynthesis
MPNFRAFWKGFGPKEGVRRLGVLSDRERRDFFAGTDLHALPSRSDSFGLVLLEAWANGKPNLAYRAGGPGELIHHHEDGLLARCGDFEDLAAKLGELVLDADMRKSLGERGRERIAREFGWKDKLQHAERVLSGASGSPENHEVNVPIRLENVKHRALFRA